MPEIPPFSPVANLAWLLGGASSYAIWPIIGHDTFGRIHVDTLLVITPFYR